MTQRKIHPLEAGIILVADGCDMTRGRTRIPLVIHSNAQRVATTFIYSAASAISRVGIHSGLNKPLRIDIEMSSEVGFFKLKRCCLQR